MAKKNDIKGDIMGIEDNLRENSMNDTLENKTTDVIDSVKQLFGFEQAFRMFLKDNNSAKSWTIEAVKVFCKKRLVQLEASLEEWFSVFNKY